MEHRIELVRAKGLDRGEREIVVDGVRWGQTIVTGHGCHGTKHVFQQEGGEVILRERGNRYSEIAVRSEKNHKWRYSDQKDNPWKPTEERVLEKIKELVAMGKLRHPDKVKAEQARAMETMRKHAEEREAKRIEAFRSKAMAAIQVNDPTSEIIDRVVEAMEWAQSQ